MINSYCKLVKYARACAYFNRHKIPIKERSSMHAPTDRDSVRFVERENILFKLLLEHVSIELEKAIIRKDLASTSWCYFALRQNLSKTKLIKEARTFLREQIKQILVSEKDFHDEEVPLKLLDVEILEGLFVGIYCLSLDEDAKKYLKNLEYILLNIEKKDFLGSIRLAGEISYFVKEIPSFAKFKERIENFIKPRISDYDKKPLSFKNLSPHEMQEVCNALFGFSKVPDISMEDLSLLSSTIQMEELTKLCIRLLEMKNIPQANVLLSQIESYIIKSFLSSNYAADFVFGLREYLDLYSAEKVAVQSLGGFKQFARNHRGFEITSDNKLTVNPDALVKSPLFKPKLHSLILFSLGKANRNKIVELNISEKEKIENLLREHREGFFSINNQLFKFFANFVLLLFLGLSGLISILLGLLDSISKMREGIVFLLNGDYGTFLSHILNNIPLGIIILFVLTFFGFFFLRNLSKKVVEKGEIRKRDLADAILEVPILHWISKRFI